MERLSLHIKLLLTTHLGRAKMNSKQTPDTRTNIEEFVKSLHEILNALVEEYPELRVTAGFMPYELTENGSVTLTMEISSEGASPSLTR